MIDMKKTNLGCSYIVCFKEYNCEIKIISCRFHINLFPHIMVSVNACCAQSILTILCPFIIKVSFTKLP